MIYVLPEKIKEYIGLFIQLDILYRQCMVLYNLTSFQNGESYISIQRFLKKNVSPHSRFRNTSPKM